MTVKKAMATFAAVVLFTSSRRNRKKKTNVCFPQIAGPLLCLISLIIIPVQAGARSDRQDLSRIVTQFCGERVCGVVDQKIAYRHGGHMLVEKRQQYVKPKVDANGMPTEKLVTKEVYQKRQRRDTAGGNVTLAGVVSTLADKAREIQAVCGSHIISAKVGRESSQICYLGRCRTSDHATGTAVDLQGNPTCIYEHLKGWPGGYTTDYWTAPVANHVHVSYNRNSPEWGKRFAHPTQRWPRVAHARLTQ